MIETPQITLTVGQLTASIHLTVAREEIRNVMGPGLREVREAIAAQGIAANGPWFTHHLKMDPGIFDFEICVPVATPFATAGRVGAGQWPATTVARTLYHGAYEGLRMAWGEFDQWIIDRGYMPRPDLWERYLVGRETESDSSSWRTELNRPLVD
jgi:effector-binding domain-containing protein